MNYSYKWREWTWLTHSIENGIATFTINRPEMRNAVNNAVMEGLEQFLDQIENNSDIAYAVITGAGDRAFCSGGDLSEFHGFRTADEAFPMLSRWLVYYIECDIADACHCGSQWCCCWWGL